MKESYRPILAIVLAGIVLLAHYYISNKYYPKKSKTVKQQVTETFAVTDDNEVKTKLGDIISRKDAVEIPQESIFLPEKLVTIDTPLYTAVFSSIGGSIKSWKMKNYRKALDSASQYVDMVAASGQDYSFSTRLINGDKTTPLNFTTDNMDISLLPGGNADVSFAWESPNGLRIEKSYTFSGDSYVLEGHTYVNNGTDSPVKGALVTSLAAYTPQSLKKGKKRKKYVYHKGGLIFEGESLERIGATNRKMKPKWFGLEDKYFLTAVIPVSDTEIEWSSYKIMGTAIRGSIAIPIDLTTGGETLFDYKAYVGPKVNNRLKVHNIGLEEAIEFGKFAFMARPMLILLNFFNRYVRNYGIAIIVLTILIKILFYPLTRYSLKSMKDMQKLQPQLVTLKEKYKDDKQRQNKEIMELYKRQKINPVGGCLPMVLQIPVFIALYEVLYVAIELRHTPFIWWIKDLSAADTLMTLPASLPYLGGSAFGPLPLLMGVTMYFQQKLSPSAMDPTQQKMMLAMPIVFTFLFLNFPAGLVLYWLLNNIIQIGQQYAIYKSR